MLCYTYSYRFYFELVSVIKFSFWTLNISYGKWSMQTWLLDSKAACISTGWCPLTPDHSPSLLPTGTCITTRGGDTQGQCSWPLPTPDHSPSLPPTGTCITTRSGKEQTNHTERRSKTRNPVRPQQPSPIKSYKLPKLCLKRFGMFTTLI